MHDLNQGEIIEPAPLDEEWLVLTPLINDATGKEVDLSDASLSLSLSQGGQIALSGSRDDGTIILLKPTLMQWRFDPQKWAALPLGEYDVHLDVEIGGEASRVFAGILPVVEGEA
jgi:hypothetical protein